MYINSETLSNQSNPAPGLILLTKEQETLYIQYNGHVTITKETDEAGAISYKVEPNKDAWESWKAAQPDPSEALAAEVVAAGENTGFVPELSADTGSGAAGSYLWLPE